MNKKGLIVIFIGATLMHCLSGNAQDTAHAPFQPKKRYTPLPVVPQFPGGRDSLALFIKKHTRYPKDAKKKHITGVIEVDFVVTKEGEITKAHVLKSLYPSCDKEALRVVKLMPRWKPAMNGREPMELDYHVDIPFGIEAPKQNHQ